MWMRLLTKYFQDLSFSHVFWSALISIRIKVRIRVLSFSCFTDRGAGCWLLRLCWLHLLLWLLLLWLLLLWSSWLLLLLLLLWSSWLLLLLLLGSRLLLLWSLLWLCLWWREGRTLWLLLLLLLLLLLSILWEQIVNDDTTATWNFPWFIPWNESIIKSELRYICS